ncbi:MAG: hypothetical protein ACHQQ3_08130, partial [Gemmatimonadales bacterium]
EVLLEGLIDYAGLFPPASLPMAEAARAFEDHRRGPHGWLLGRFVVPVARLKELEGATADMERRGTRWRLSLLGGAGDGETIERFNERHAGRLAIDSLEGKATTVEEISTFAALSSLLGPEGDPFLVFVEIPIAGDPAPLVAAIGAHGLRAKVRTGGVTPDAFPRAAHVARFLTACAEQDVVFKATAGLHHPWCGAYRLTYESGSAHHTMFGFLNVFLAALFLRAGLSEARAVALLEERDPAAFDFDAGGVTWGGHRLDAHSIDAMRARFAASFGSCSFTEPVNELTALGLL